MAPGLEFRHGDRLEPDSVTGPDREVAELGIGDAEWSHSEQMPTSRRLAGIDRRLAAGDGDRPRRHAEPGRITSRQAAEGRGEIARVGEPRLKADRENMVLDRAVQVDHFEPALLPIGPPRRGDPLRRKEPE